MATQTLDKPTTETDEPIEDDDELDVIIGTKQVKVVTVYVPVTSD